MTIMHNYSAAPLPPALQFINDQAEADYHRRVAQARARQTVPFAVAPGCTLPCKRGVLEAGEEVTLDDFHEAVDAHGAVVFTPLDRLRRLVLEGIVLERK